MVWHIKKTSLLSGAGTVYYQGDNKWISTYGLRKIYTSQAKAKAEDYIWTKKTTNNWDLVAVNENA